MMSRFSRAIRAQFDMLWQDLGWTQRSLRRSPTFTLTAIIVAAIGIGASTAAFTLLDHVLLRPLPFPNPEQLVVLYQTQLTKGNARTVTSPANYLDWQSMSKSFETVGAYTTASVNLSGQAEPQRLEGVTISAEVFKALNVQPVVGRSFTNEDMDTGAANVVLLSDSLASALFGRATDAFNRSLLLDSTAYTVVGVMPAGFSFPTRETQLWLPLQFNQQGRQNRTGLFISVIGRLKPGVTVDQARTEMGLIGQQLESTYPKENGGMGATAVGMQEVISPQSRTLVIAVFAAALCLILITCTNLANLLFARFLSRRQEIATRIAIGAGRERLLRQLITENFVLAIIGGGLGLLLGWIATPALARLVPEALPITGLPQMNLRVFGFAALLTLLTCIAFGVGPALRAARQIDLNALRAKSTVASRSDKVRQALVLAEVACTVILLIGAGLMAKALWRVQSVHPGFRAENVLTMRTTLPLPKYNNVEPRTQFYSNVLTKVRALPGVNSASYNSFLPMVFRGGIFPVTAPGTSADTQQTAVQTSIRFVTQDFFTTLGIPIRQGRDISDRDTAKAPSVTVISESLARRLWPNQDPIGKQVNVALADRTVVGVVGDISVRGLERTSEPQVYLSSQQVSDGALSFFSPKDMVVRTSGNPTALATAIRGIVHEVDPDQPVSSVRTLEDVLRLETESRRSQLNVLGSFALIATLLAAIGIYGLMSFTVSNRTQEVGVRLALGAQPRSILTMFLRRGLLLGILGVVIGVPLAYFAARGMAAILFGVKPGDPLIYVGASLLAVAMALAGSFWPARRASNVDPAISIRNE
jgi:putative ABC transport system permease protein